ncbi:MAG TPA: hypothetical protein VKY74_26305 [Chloroflexia bacterium]|nr:hypothetical protein [Chloroflexia bacterium]
MSGLDPYLATLEVSGLIRLAQMVPELEYLFRHALVQDAAYISLLKEDRKRLHRTVGEALEQLYPDRLDDLAPLLARHFQGAGDDDRALHYFTRAGDRALAVYANQEAERHYRAALALASAGSMRPRLLTGLGEALTLQSRADEAIATWRAAIALYQAQGAADPVARLYSRAARAAFWSGDKPGSLAICREGLAQVAPGAESPGVAALLHETARSSFFNGLPADAATLCGAASAMATRLGDVEVQAEALATLGLLRDRPLPALLAALEQAVALSEGAGLLAIALRAHTNLGGRLVDAGELLAAQDHILRAAQLAHLRGAAAEELYILIQAVWPAFFLGNFQLVAEMLPVLRQLQATLDSNRRTTGLAPVWVEAGLQYYQGAWGAAADQLRACCLEAQRLDDLSNFAQVSCFLAEVLIELRAWDEAAAVLAPALTLGDRGLDLNGVEPRMLLVSACAGGGQYDAARRVLAAAWHKAGPAPSRMDARMLALAEARLAAAEQRWPDALAAFQAVVAADAQMGMRWYQARTLWEWADALLARGAPGDPARAGELLHAAHALFVALDVPRYAAWVGDRLQALAAPPA